MINIIVLGYHLNCIRLIQKIKDNPNVCILRVILPGNRSGRYIEKTIDICDESGIPYSINKDKEILKETVSEFNDILDLIVVASFMQLIPKEVLNIPKKGTINLHESLLPKHRGPHPVNWAIILGEEKTGCTVHFMTEKIDAGDIILQKEIYIGEKDVVQLTKELGEVGSDLLVQAIEKFVCGMPEGIPQDESKATYGPLRKPEDGEIPADASVRTVLRYIRALKKPWPGASLIINDKRYILYDGSIIEEKLNETYPLVEEYEDRLVISFSDGIIEVRDFEYGNTL
jgi:methionyl-tRNA formyltransferase